MNVSALTQYAVLRRYMEACVYISSSSSSATAAAAAMTVVAVAVAVAAAREMRRLSWRLKLTLTSAECSRL